MNHKKNENNKNRIMVYIETDDAGKIMKNSLEALGAAYLIASESNCEICAVMIGNNMGLSIERMQRFPVDRIIAVCGKEEGYIASGKYVRTMIKMIDKHNPALVLIPGSIRGREIAPRIAALLDWPVLADCMNVRVSKKDNRVYWDRLSFGGRICCEAGFMTGQPGIVTLRSGLFSPAVEGDYAAEIEYEELISGVSIDDPMFIKTIEKAAIDMMAIEDAEIIVAGGRGSGPEGFVLIKELADVLGACVGASRVAVDKGWMPHSALIGQSGKIVTPKLYINCGIAGSIQHIMGMRDSDCVVSINIDPKALIFDVSDYGIVGDLFKVLPVLTDEIRRIKAM